MTSQSEIRELLAGFPLFRQLDEQSLTRMASGSRERRLDRNEVLFQKGDPARCLNLVVYGQMKLALPAANGNEKVVELIGPLQSFGEEALLSDSPHPVFAQAVAETLLVQVAKGHIVELIEHGPLFSRCMLATLARRTQNLIQDVGTYSQQTGTQRVIGFLRQQCPHVGNTDASIAIMLPASKQIIASRLNLTPETLSRILHDLSQADLIEVQGKKIVIHNLNRLREYDDA